MAERHSDTPLCETPIAITNGGKPTIPQVLGKECPFGQLEDVHHSKIREAGTQRPACHGECMPRYAADATHEEIESAEAAATRTRKGLQLLAQGSILAGELEQTTEALNALEALSERITGEVDPVLTKAMENLSNRIEAVKDSL